MAPESYHGPDRVISEANLHWEQGNKNTIAGNDTPN
jgi:hypothetical protein